MPKTEAIAHEAIEPSTAIAYKIGGRWYWITAVDPDRLESGTFFVWTVPAAKDPRYADLGYAKLRVITSHTTVLVRAQDAPVWDWVTRKIEDKAKLAAYNRRELELTKDEYIALRIRVGDL